MIRNRIAKISPVILIAAVAVTASVTYGLTWKPEVKQTACRPGVVLQQTFPNDPATYGPYAGLNIRLQCSTEGNELDFASATSAG